MYMYSIKHTVSIFKIFSLSSASGLSGALSGVVQGLQSERLTGRYRQIIPAASRLDHAHSPAICSEPDRWQWEYGPPLQRVPFKLSSCQTFAGYW